MKEEMNHLIEYYTVLKKAGQMIFGEEIQQDKKNFFGSNQKADDPEGNLLKERRRGNHSDSGDNSDDYLFGQDSGYQRRSNNDMQTGISIAYMSGTINHTEQRQFEKLMFRASRGKVLTRFHDQSFTIKDYDGLEKTKTVYVLVYQEGAQMKEKVTRVCQSFQGKIFTLPEDG